MDEEVIQGRFVGTFLDSPIISSDRDAFLYALRTVDVNSQGQKDPSVRKAQYIIKVIKTSNVVALEPENYGWFIEALDPESTVGMIRSARENVNTIVRILKRSGWDWGRLVSSGLSEMLDLPSQVEYNFSRMHQLNAIITLIATTRAKGVRNTLDVISGNIRYVGDQHYGCVSLVGKDEWMLITYTQLLMLKDMMYARFNAYVAAEVVYAGKPEILHALDMVIKWEMKCIGIYGNQGYELLKSIESLAKCNLTRMSDRFLADHGSYQSMKEKVCEKEVKLSRVGSPLTEELCTYLESLSDIEVAVEVFGLQKLSGHPLVDPVLAGRSVKEEAQKKISYSPVSCARLRNNCCRIYTEGFVRKNGRWPPLVFGTQHRRSRLFQLYTLNELSLRADSYPLSDWDGVRFAAHLTFEGYQNYLDLMDDKAVSLYREDCRATWDRKLSPHSSKRLLIELLSREDFNVMSIVDRVRRGDIPSSWLIVSLYPKEREMKIAARLFSMMVIEMRVFFAACEANLAEFVYPCLQAQTMTLTKQEVKELFTTLTREHSDEELTRLYLEVDLSRWNLRWHPEVVDPVGEDLNNMFGLEGVFNTIHHFFKRCLILVRVQSAPPPGIMLPEIPESDLCFYNHEVGFEGIAQKLWSFLTFGMIDLAMIDHEGPYYLVGQGDNQVLLMTVSLEGVRDKENHMRTLTTRLTARIEKECSDVGQEAKPEECIQSTSVVTYSKNVYIRGVEYHTAIKGCSRIFPSSSSDFPSINGSMGAISSSCTAASELMVNPLDAYRLMIFHLSLYLSAVKEGKWVESCLLTPRWRAGIDNQLILSLLVLPNDLGGCMVAPLTAFLYKGGGDSLSKSIASLKFFQDSSDVVRSMIWSLRNKKWVDKSIEIRALLEDPFSIPLRRARGADQSVKGESLDCVKALSKNEELSEILSSNVELFDEEVIRILSTCTPFNPVLLSDVIGFSVLGVRSSLLNMFISTGTVQSLLHSSGGLEFSLCLRVLHTGTLFFQDAVGKIRGLGSVQDKISSVYDFAKSLRDSWVIDKKQVNLVGVNSYTPFDFSVSLTSDFKGLNAFRTLFSGEGYRVDQHTRGEWSHYDGLDTKEKRSEYGYKIVTSTTAAQAVARLAGIATQPGVSEEFVDLIATVALTRTAIDLRGVLPLLSRAVGGSIAHRYSSIFGNRGAYGLNTTTWSTHCYPYTDTVEPFSASSVDYPIMMQEMMVAGIAAARLFSLGGACTGIVNLSGGDTIFEALPDEEVKVSMPPTIDLPQYQRNKLVFDPDLRLRKVTGAVDSSLVSDVEGTTQALDLVLEAVRSQIRQGYLKNNVALRIMDSSAKFSHVRLDVLEIINIGIKRVCDVFALEIAALAGNQTMTISNSMVRWTPVPAIVSLAFAAANTLSTMVSHPQVREDPFIRDMIPLSLFKYSFSGGSVSKKIHSYIVSVSMKLLLKPGSRLYKYPEVIFPDDGANNLVYLISRRLRLILLQSVLLGEIPPSSVSALTKLVVLKPMRGGGDDEEKVAQFALVSSTLLQWAESQNLPVLSSHVRMLVNGRSLQRHLRSSKEVIRLSRTLVAARPSAGPSRGVTEQTFRSMFSKVDVQGIEVIREGWERPFSGLGLGGITEEKSYKRFHIRRMRGRVYGRESNACYSYYGIAHLTSQRVCLIVGCGYGSGAAVILASGGTHVIGLDYLDDLKTEELLRGNVIPPAVQALGLGERFTRVDVSPIERGDIYDPSTADRLRRYSAGGTLCLVDIRVSSSAEIIALISNLHRYSETAEVLWRFIGTESDTKVILSTLLASGCLKDTYSVFKHGGWCEVWFHFQFTEKTSFVGGVLGQEVVIPHGGKVFPNLSFLGGGKAYLSQMALGPYANLSYDEIEINTVIFADALRASIGGLDHRFSYDQFTTVLHANLFSKVATEEDPLATLDSFIDKGEVEVEILRVKVNLRQSRSLDSILFTLLPRIMAQGRS